MESGTQLTPTPSGKVMNTGKSTENVLAKSLALVIIVFFVVCISAILLTSKNILTRLSGANIGYFVLILLFIVVSFVFGFVLFHFTSDKPSTAVQDAADSTTHRFITDQMLTHLMRYGLFFVGMTIMVILTNLIMNKVGTVSMYYSIIPAFIFTGVVSTITLLFTSFLYKGNTFLKFQTEGKKTFHFEKDVLIQDMKDNESFLILTFYLTFIPFFLYYNPFNWAVKYLMLFISLTIIFSSVLFGSVYAKLQFDKEKEVVMSKNAEQAYDVSKSILRNTNLLIVGLIISSLVIYCIYKAFSKIGSVLGKSVGFFPQLIQIAIIISALGLFYKAISSADYFKHLPPVLRVAVYSILYIPCLLTVCIDYTVDLFAPGKKRTYMILIIMISLFLILYFTLPLLEQLIILQKGKMLLNEPIALNVKTTLATYEDLYGPNPKLDPQYKKYNSNKKDKTNKYWGTIAPLQESATTKTSKDISNNVIDHNVGVIKNTESGTTASGDIDYEGILFGKNSSSGFLPNISSVFNIDSSGSGVGAGAGSGSGSSSSSSNDSLPDDLNTSTDLNQSNYYKEKKTGPTGTGNNDTNVKNLNVISSAAKLVGIGKGSYNPHLSERAQAAADQTQGISSKATVAGSITDNITPGTIVQASTTGIHKNTNNFSYRYGVSFWVFLEAKPPSTNVSHNSFASILSYGNKPNITYRANTNTLRIVVQYSNVANKGVNNAYDTSDIPMDEEGNRIVFETNTVPIQEWVHFVINEFGGTLDIFMDNVLVGSADFAVPYMTYDSLTCGSIDGINGGICNIVFYREPLTTNQINVIYQGSQGKSAPTLKTFL